MNTQKTAIIIGAGPAGLTAAYELLAHSKIKPVIFEQTGEIGGISKTVTYNGNRIDIGGHRFFSKSERIVNWWLNILPLQGAPARDYKELGIEVQLASHASYHRIGESLKVTSEAPDPEKVDRVFLVRNRKSRIYFLGSFFDYPITFCKANVLKFGLKRILRIGFSYLKILIAPIRHEKSLEDFFINRFGRELYGTFFKDYTEKVWGVPCSSIKPEWGAQRIKGISISKTILHFLQGLFIKDWSINNKKVEPSLIEQFMYPKFGPGQMWETVAAEIAKNGGELHLHTTVVGIAQKDGAITSVTVRDSETGAERQFTGDYFFSSMPVKDLIEAITSPVPGNIRQTAKNLKYRDFITVGLLVDELLIKNNTDIKTIHNLIPDNWIYVQSREVMLGRIQIFNNWSPYMVETPDKVWLGLEYFCQEGDDLWTMQDTELITFAGNELAKTGIIDSSSIRDGIVLRVPKAYPAYFGSYGEFGCIRQFTDKITNLFLIGRNGMHRYNNMDHSMMTAMVAVENMINGITEKDNIWQVNMEESYHENK